MAIAANTFPRMVLSKRIRISTSRSTNAPKGHPRRGCPPYEWLNTTLTSVMPAHVTYPKVERARGLLGKVVQDILRGQLGYTGAICSDDLSMAGALDAGSAPKRRRALNAGCEWCCCATNRSTAASRSMRCSTVCSSARARRMAGRRRQRSAPPRPVAANRSPHLGRADAPPGLSPGLELPAMAPCRSRLAKTSQGAQENRRPGPRRGGVFSSGHGVPWPLFTAVAAVPAVPRAVAAAASVQRHRPVGG